MLNRGPRAPRPAPGGSGWHNGPVMRRTPARPLRAVATLVAGIIVPALVLSGCGAAQKKKAEPTPTPSAPTPSVEVPAGVSLTDAGTKLAFGGRATVPYQPNQQRGTVLALTVEKVTKARMKDFASYVLDDRTKASTPYYVEVKVANVGAGDVGGTDVPLWAVDRTNTLIHSSSFTNTYQRCPSAALPASFPPHATATSCLVYLVPDHGELTAVSFRPLQAFEPIEWTGTIATEHTKKTSEKSSKKPSHKSSKKAKKKS